MSKPANVNAGRKRPRGPRTIPLLMLGSDGAVYACCLAEGLPASVLAHPHTVVAIRLSKDERDVALDALQPGIQAAARAAQGVLDTKS